MEGFLDFCRRNKWKVILVLVGVVFTILVFTINFWRALLLLVVTVICYVIGALLDEGGRARVSQFFNELFKKN
ncbi:MAG: DUF2273 domain-containing protein [Clostridia bacterium]